MGNYVYTKLANSGITKLSAVRSARRFVLNHVIRQPIKMNGSFYMFMEAHQPLGMAMNRTYEPEETNALNGVVRDGMVALNIGASMGYYALLLALKCRKVYAVEPNAVNYGVLVRNVHANRMERVVEAQKVAIGAGRGRTRFDSNIGDDYVVKVDAPTRELDKFMKRRLQPDVIVMDVDGAEGKVLDGGAKTFGSAKYILFENNLGRPFLRRIERLGFRVRPITHNNYLAEKVRGEGRARLAYGKA